MAAEHNHNSEDDENLQRLEKILRALANVNGMLRRYNEENGNISRYNSMRKEIETLGWDGILRQYHPDINVQDPAAVELFDLYRYVYQTMQSE